MVNGKRSLAARRVLGVSAVIKSIEKAFGAWRGQQQLPGTVG